MIDENVRIPIALDRDTILECVAEMRFESTSGSIEETLPGMAYQHLKNLYKRPSRQPFADVPRSIRDNDPNLRFQATHRLEGDGCALLLGGHVAAVSFPKPYPGWQRFKEIVEQSFLGVLSTDEISQVERISLRYSNVLCEGRDEFDLEQVKVEVRFGTFALRKNGRVFRAEIDMDGCIAIVEIAPGTIVSLPGRAAFSGVLLNVDVIRNGPLDEFKERLPELLDTVHNVEKRVFFGLLTNETLARLGPKWTQ